VIFTQQFQNVPIFWLRLMPALCGSLLVPIVYNLLIQLRINRWVAAMGGLLIVFGMASIPSRVRSFTL
jgi:dolichyl-phosphate-mannose-protein mannosyltransferase